MAPPRASRPRHHPTVLARALALTSVAVVVLPGCLRGDALKLATIAAVVAVKTVQLVAASSRQEGRGKVSSGSGGYSGRAGGPCGVCREPDNGYAVCFVSTCEIRCIDGYVLVGDRCESASRSGWEAPDG
ncbi:MAG: hypothetical protein IPQ09_16215 [Myxococcales bacterium]|nr:hypothetical protein [Myxococcales bacterium]